MKRTRAPLAHFDNRPAGTAVDTIVIHSLFAPGAANCFDPASCIALLDQERVSAHFIIDQAGNVVEAVPEDQRAWHAGVSQMPAPDLRENVNHFSIGIELIGDLALGFSAAQYAALAELTVELSQRHPLQTVIGHEHIAPGRKIDPGPLFDWVKYRNLVHNLLGSDRIQFPR